MESLTRQQARDFDRRATEELGIPSIVLMENAGRGVVDVLLRREATPRTVFILCGKGNNGGDGFVIARHLALRGVNAKVALLAPPNELQGDALTNYRIFVRSHLPLVDLSQVDYLREVLDREAMGTDWLIDALLGTGAHGEPREPYRTVIEWMNRQQAQRLAVDVPSGLDCDTGKASAATVRAEVTCTFVAPKVGFTNPAASEFLGELDVVDIGIPPQALRNLTLTNADLVD